MLERGAEGGREASQRLCDEVRAYHEPILGKTFKVVVQVFLDLHDLASVCQMSRLELHEFYEGFSIGRDFCDYYDIGAGAGKASKKLLGKLRCFTFPAPLGNAPQ